MIRSKRHLIIIGIHLFLIACSSQSSAADITISGAVNRHISQAAVYYEGTSSGRRLYIERQGPGEDIQVLTLELPADVTPGTYTFGSSGPVSAAYFEFVNGVSSQFQRNVSGSITISETEGEFSGQMDLYATAPFTQDSIRITGSFTDIPYGAGGGSGDSLAGATVICGLVTLILINFVLQFYVGSRVFAPEGGSILQSLRGTRVFIRGWQLPEIRFVMVIWSFFLVLLILVLGILGLMAALSFG